jgi:hypothetical protein
VVNLRPISDAYQWPRARHHANVASSIVWGLNQIAEDWTNRLRVGERAIRGRLTPVAPARGGRIVGRVVPVPAVDAELGGSATDADLSAADVASDAQAVMTEAVSEPPALIEAKLPSVAGGIEPEDSTNNSVSVGFAELAVVHRSLEATAAPRDRTFWIALGLVLALHAGALVGTLRFDASETARREREGQVDEPTTITVELVENADAKSKEKMAQIGERVAAPR